MSSSDAFLNGSLYHHSTHYSYPSSAQLVDSYLELVEAVVSAGLLPHLLAPGLYTAEALPMRKDFIGACRFREKACIELVQIATVILCRITV